MLKPLFDASTIPLLEKLAVFSERRQQVLAGNIANIDTPNYKTRDLPVEAFQRALQEAIARGKQPASLAAITPGGLSQTGTFDDLFPEKLFQAVESPARDITFQDGNNRNIENEVMEMTKNAMMQRFAVELLTAQFNMLQTVISERA